MLVKVTRNSFVVQLSDLLLKSFSERVKIVFNLCFVFHT